MLTKELLQFVQQEKNISLEFVKQVNACEEGDYKVYLYGAGVQKLYVVRFLQKHGIKICAILDSFQQGCYKGIPIVLFDDFLRSNPDPKSLFVISAPSVEHEIREALEGHFPEEQIFCFETSPYVEWIPDVEEYRAYLVEHWDEFSQMYDTLADARSKETFVNIIKGRISGRTDYFRAVYEPDPYYPKDVVHLSDREVLAEVGSYDGTTLGNFLRRCPDYKAAYCFEPDSSNLRVLYRAVERLQQDGKIKVVPYGAWDHKGTLYFSNSGGATNLSHVVEERSQSSDCIEVVTVDETIPEPITYMTISSNGAEMHVLYGAKQQIAKNHPKLAVYGSCSGGEFLDIWNYLRELVPGYRFYLRHHLEHGGIESFLYAV